MAEMESSVSISITSAIVYVISGLVFFLLVFLLVMMGVTNCNWECEGGSVFGNVEHEQLSMSRRMTMLKMTNVQTKC